ncbi:MAG: OB-fold nucleic acid binding domain-containing protein [Candidatus Thalassarchaeaceae archaeon]|nr:OB-fold nucleic acid binding domain-containing protein [Candidatus Thalassarchaeaceae archaeon]
MPVIPQPSGIFARSRRRLSASSMVTWERCRRDWFLTRRLGLQVPTHPEMRLGHIVEEAATAIWMERPHPTDGMPSGKTNWVEGEVGEIMPISNLEELKSWLRSLMKPIVDEIRRQLNETWAECIWKAEGRSPDEIKREKLNSMVKNAIKLQIEEAEACLEANGGPHLEAFRERGDPFGTPAPCWGEGIGEGWQDAGSQCTWWEAWEIARPWAKDPRISTAQRLFHPDGWAAGELDMAHRWRGNIHIVDIKANRGHDRDHGGVATQLRFYQWLWTETRKHPAKPVNHVLEGEVEAIKSWHLADGFVHTAELLTNLEVESERLLAIQQEMASVAIEHLQLDAIEAQEGGSLGCSICFGLDTCDYPRGGQEQPLHRLIPAFEGKPAGPPFAPISELPSRVTIRGALHGHWGPLPNHYGDSVIGAAITAGDKTAVIEEMGIKQFPGLHEHKGEVVIVNAAPGQWRGMVRLYLDRDSQILRPEDVESIEINRLGLIPTRANVAGTVISRGSNRGTNASGKAWSMSTAHIWDGTGLCEVVAFGLGRTESFDNLRVGDMVRLMSAEIGWREGTPQLRIDPRNTRLIVEGKPPR